MSNPGFPRGGHQLRSGVQQLIVLQFCFRKIHENKSILDQEGSTLPHRPPLDPSLHYPGADPGFPVGGSANPNFQKNRMKLRKIWAVGGGGARRWRPLRSATATILFIKPSIMNPNRTPTSPHRRIGPPPRPLDPNMYE